MPDSNNENKNTHHCAVCRRPVNPEDATCRFCGAVLEGELRKNGKKIFTDFVERWEKLDKTEQMTPSMISLPEEEVPSRYTVRLKRCERILEKNPNDPKAWFGKGMVLFEMDRFEEALDCLETATMLDPSHKEAWNIKATIYSRIGKHQESADCYKKALEITSGRMDGTSSRMGTEEETFKEILKEADKDEIEAEFSKEIRQYEERLKNDPNDKDALFYKALALVKLNRPKEAMNFLHSLTRLDMSYPGIWQAKGDVFKMLGDDRNAALCYKKAMETLPEQYACPICGNFVDADITRCPRCGSVFEGEDEELELPKELEELAVEPEPKPEPPKPTIPKPEPLKPAEPESEPKPRPPRPAVPKPAVPRPAVPKPEVPAHLLHEPVLFRPAETKPVRRKVKVKRTLKRPVAVKPEPVRRPAVKPTEVKKLPKAKPLVPSRAIPKPRSKPKPRVTATRKAIAEKGLTNGLVREKAVTERVGKINGLINGRGQINGLRVGKINGLINGKGRINGLKTGRINGLVNGKGRINGMINGARKGRINGMINGAHKGRINGLINGMGRINGLINGIRTGRVNGLVNGFKSVRGGLTNGITNGVGITNGLGFNRFYKDTAMNKWKMLVIPLVAAFLLFVPYYTNYQPTEVAHHINIDGEFDDWEGLTTPITPSVWLNPSIDIVKVAVENNYDYLSFYIETKDIILRGGNDTVDTFHIFIDYDLDSDTGYRINHIGADYRVSIYGKNSKILGSTLKEFDKDRSQDDWNGWVNSGATETAINGNKLEAQIAWHSLMGMEQQVDAYFYSQDYNKQEDFAELIMSNAEGLLDIEARSVVSEVIIGDNNPLLELRLIAVDADIEVSELRIELLGTAESSEISTIKLFDQEEGFLAEKIPTSNYIVFRFGEPLEIAQDSSKELVVVANIRGSSSNTIGASILSPRNVKVVDGAVNLEVIPSNFEVGYIGNVPPGKIIDGGFSDWEDAYLDTDQGQVDNPNINIQNFNVSTDNDNAYFYLKVEGALLDGALVPVWNLYKGPTPPAAGLQDSDRDRMPDAVDPYPYDFNNDFVPDTDTNFDVDADGQMDYPHGNDLWLNTTIPNTTSFNIDYRGLDIRIYIGPVVNPVLTGEDTALIYIDSDNITGSGYSVSGLGADYLVEIKGENGGIVSKALYRFDSTRPWEWKWQNVSDVITATDSSQLEARVDLSTLGLSPTDNFDAYFWTTDWDHVEDHGGVIDTSGGGLKESTKYYQERDQQSFGNNGDVGTCGADVWGVEPADLDNDGDDDLVIGCITTASYEVMVFQNDGTPFKGMWSSNDVGTTDDHVYQVTVADFDDDGYTDIVTVTGSSEDNEVIIWKNDGTPFTGTWTPTDVGPSADIVWSVEVADFDNDGDIDIVTGSGPSEDYEIMVWDNDGSPFSGSWTNNSVGTLLGAAYAVEVADFDKDGDTDIVCGSHTDEDYEVSIWENDGSPFAGEWTQNNVGTSTALVRDVAVADLDNDGWVDIGTASYDTEDYEIIVWQNDKSPFSGTWTPNDVGALANSPYTINFADLDNDGDQDIAISTNSGEDFEVNVWENDGSPFSGYWTQNDVAASRIRTRTAAVADFDNDGFIDIVAGHDEEEDYELVIYRNDGTPFTDLWLGGLVGASSDSVRSAEAADFDQDGDLDLVTTSYSGENNEVIVWQNDGTPFNDLWVQNDVGATAHVPYSVKVADLDNDGWLDIITGVRSDEDYEVIVWANDQTPFSGTWTPNDVGASADHVLSVAVADFDLDGDIDIASGSYSTEDYELILWQNDGTPFTDYWTQNDIGATQDSVYAISAADFDNDGDTDIVSGTLTGADNEVLVWENDGSPFTGTWTNNSVGATAAHVYMIDVADFDNNGDIDIVTSCNTDEDYEVIVWQNDGSPFTGSWTNNSVGASTTSVFSVSAEDFDNDGYQDLVTGTQLAEDFDVIVWENDGSPFTGTWDQDDVGSVVATVYDVGGADFDNDGDLDVFSVMSSPDIYEVRIWENTLTHINLAFHPNQYNVGGGANLADFNSVALTDLDNDGDIDIVTGCDSDEDYEVIVWENDGTPYNTLWTQNDVGASDDEVNSVAVADFDGDGYMDIVTGSDSAEDNEIIVWQNDGTPFSGTWTSNDVGASADDVNSVAVADFDDDGNVDIVSGSGSTEDNEVIVWKNDGSPFSGTWTSNDVGASTDNVIVVAVADLDDNDDIDIVSGSDNGEDNEIIAWQNDGTPFTGTWTQNDVGTTNGVNDLDLADFDNDDYTDIVTTYGLDVKVWQNDGSPFTGTWTGNTIGSVSIAYAIATGDFDADGYIDIVAGADDTYDFTITVWENDGTPFSGSWTHNDVGSSAYSIYDLAVIDFDNPTNGVYPDIVSVSTYFEDYDVILWQNDETPFTDWWQEGDVGASVGFVYEVATADFDNDGDMDIASGSYETEDYELILWQNDGTPFTGLWTQNDAGATDDAIDAMAVADLDNDGDMDIVTGGHTNEDPEIIVWQNDGSPFTGTWSPNDVGASDYHVVSVAVADFDNDGYMDIVSGSFDNEDYEVIVWQNDGSPFSGSWTQNDAGASADHVYSVAVADFDNDGDMDIVSGAGAGEDYEVIVWQNDGNPFTTSPWTNNSVGASTTYVYSVAVADFDNDGNMDIVSGSANGENYEVILWQNDGTPFSDLWTQNDVGASVTDVFSVNAADFDNDGDMDVVSGGVTDEDYEVIVWQNDGTPFTGFWTQNDVGACADWINLVAVADFDNDGGTDIVSGSFTTEDYEVMIWRNLGAQVTVTPTDTSPSTFYKGETDDLLSITVKHNGISGDNDIELKTWKFKFYQSNGTTALTASEMSDTFSNYYIYFDDDYDDTWTPSDTQLSTSSATSGNTVTLSFTDGDTDAQLTQGQTKTFFLVVKISSSASQISTFRVKFDPDGYGTGDYNEVENANTDGIVTVSEAYPRISRVITLGTPSSLYHLVTGDGADNGDRFGWNVSYAGDINNDGYDDVIVGAPYNDTSDGSKEDAGAAYIFFGYSTISSGNINAATANVSIYGENAGDHFGWSVSDLSSVDSDTIDDIIIGAPDYDGSTIYMAWGSSDLQINTDPSSSGTKYPDVVVDSEGNSIYVWRDTKDSDDNIYAQKFDPQGNALWSSTDVLVNKVSDGANQDFPAIAIDSDDNVIIAWQDERNGAANISIYAQKLDPYGNKLWDSNDIRINQATTSANRIEPCLAIDSSGNVVIAWQDARDGATNNSIYAQRLDSSGNILWGSSDIRVNQNVDIYMQEQPDMAMDSSGNAIVVWSDDRLNGDNEIYGQKLNLAGSPQWTSSDKKMNQINDGSDQEMPAVAVDSDDNVIVVWSDDRTAVYDIYAQKFNSAGTAQWSASDKIVNQDSTTTSRDDADVAVDSSGNSIIAWMDERNGATNITIYAQMLASNGTYQWGKNDELVNQNVDLPKQEYPAVAIDSDGCAIVTWDDERTDDDIYAQKIFCEDAGRAYIFYGTTLSGVESLSASGADVKIDGENNGNRFGASVSRAGNVDGSTYNDTIIGALSYDLVSNDRYWNIGRAYIFYGDGSIPTAADKADKTYTGEAAGDMFGFSVSTAGDVDNDGKDDVIVGAPYNDDSGTNAGEAYIYFSGDQYVYVDSNTDTYGYTSNFNNAKSASDSGAYATLTEEEVSWYGSGGSEVTIDDTLDNTDTEYNPSPSGVFISDTVGYVFYIEKWSSNNRQVSYRKTTNGGTSWGSPVSISTDLDWRNVAIWYDKWTPGGTGDKIHIAAVNDDNPDVQYRWLNTTDSDSLRSSWVSIFDVGSWSVPNGGPSIVNSTDGILYVSGFGGTTSAVYRSTNNGTSWTDITPSYYFDEGDDHAQLIPLSGGDILCIYHDTTTITTDWGRWFVWDEETDAWNSSANQLAVWTYNSNYPAVFGASLDKTTGDVYLGANMDPGDATNNLKSYFFDESVRAFTTKTDIYNNIGADGTDVKIFVNEDNGDVFGIYGRGGGSAQIYYKKSTDGMETWGAETQISTNADDHRIIRPNFMSDERLYAFWYNDDTDDLLGNSACDIKSDYQMDIEFNTASVPSGSYSLELNYSVDGTETAFGVLVYDGSSWDDQTAQGDLSQTSFTEKSYTLDSDHRLSSGNVRVRFIGRNETSDSVNSTLKIEYHRIAITNSYLTLSGEYAGHRFGWSVANASDVNNDGSYDDVIVGAPYYRSEPYSAVWSSSDVMAHQNPDSADQGSSDITADENGNVFVAWQDERNGVNSDDIFAQKIDPYGNPQWGSSDLKVHTDSGLVQYGPSVAIDPNGNLIVVWSDERHGSTNDSIYAQKLDTNGNKLWDTSDVRVNQYTTSCTMIVSDIAVDSDGNAIIVWRDNRNSDYDIFAQKLDPNGIVQWGASDVKVNQYSSSENEFGPTLALDPLGYAIVVWQDGRNGVTTNDSIYAQMLDKDGDALWGSSDVRVHQDDGTYRRSSPKIAADSDGNSVVVWTDERNGGSDARIYGQRLSRYGVVQWSADVQVNQDTTDETGGAAIAVDSNGHFFVAWQDQSGNSDIYSQKLDLDGNVHWGSSDLRLNQGVGDFHTAPQLTVDNNDNLIALFVNTTGDWNVLMQKFQATDITGRAYIFNGASGMDATADVSLTGENDGDKFGFSVHGASDIGGDGVPDVIVGAPYYDDGATADVGNVYIYYGGSSMDSSEDYIHKGTQENMHFGWSVSLALSMDGGSYKQVVVGGPHFDDGSDEDAGTAEVLNIFVIPEFSTIVIPIFVIILFVIMWRRRKYLKSSSKH